MRSFRAHQVRLPAILVVFAWAHTAHADFPDPSVAPKSVLSGCLNEGATMYARVTKNGVGTTQIYIVDDDGNGLPDKVYCGYGPGWSLNDGSASGSGCTSLQTIPGGALSGCPFTIKVFMGSGSPDAEAGPAPIDCSGIDHPMLFFGGEGRDRFIGTDHGDFFNGGVKIDWLYGGAGPDFICASEGEQDLKNHVFGDGDPDLVWGGPNDDECHGGLDTDLVIGAVQNDDVFGDEDPDYVHGASHTDTCDGGAFEDEDLVHTGESEDEEFVIADDGIVEPIYAADDVLDTITSDTSDACVVDAADSGTCTSPQVNPVCTTEHPFVVGIRDYYDVATLFELEYDGDVGVDGGTQTARVWLDSLDEYADRIVGLAVNPADCTDLAALVELDGDQYLARIVLSTQPDSLGGVGYVTRPTPSPAPSTSTATRSSSTSPSTTRRSSAA